MLSRIATSIGTWFLVLFSLNVLDILITIPAYEVNPVTLHLWGSIGIYLSAWFKLGLILLLAGLCYLTKLVATPTEWAFSRKLFNGILIILVAFYTFVVIWNTLIFSVVNF
jgi:hypothetical protein